MSVTKAVILAAGEGNRMRPLTYTRPKVMLPIANKPILEHLIEIMKECGIKEFFLIVGYHNEQIRNYFGDGSKWNINIQYTNQMKQLGTADALRMVKDYISEDFLMANGDILVHQQDVRNLLAKPYNAMTVVDLPDVAGLGVIETKEDSVVRIYEKMANPPSHLANAGLYRFTPAIFTAVDKTEKSLRGEYELTDSIQILINSGLPVTYQVISEWLDLSYPWNLLTANETILSGMKSHIEGDVEPNASIAGSVSIGKGTTVRSGAYIVGPVVIGQNCDIGPNCFIRPSSAIGDNCHIGAAVELKNSIIMSGSKVPHLNYVGDSILGENCNLGAGTKIANLKLDKKNILVNGLDTRRRKLGAIIGDNVQTGINACINVGTLIGNDTFIGPGALARGTVAPGSKVF
jgi:UDP-N-acetylglucosamine diphosphorylase/glucosamine-1-phosphate N-acetyltransferase